MFFLQPYMTLQVYFVILELRALYQGWHISIGRYKLLADSAYIGKTDISILVKLLCRYYWQIVATSEIYSAKVSITYYCPQCIGHSRFSDFSVNLPENEHGKNHGK